MIRYKKRRDYKYILHDKHQQYVPIHPSHDVVTPFITLTTEGQLIIYPGYAWDGASGPAIDTKNFMRGSLIHDALYQLMRERHLPGSCRQMADEALREACLEDGMSSIRAWWVYRGVRLGGGSAIKYDVLEAP